MYVERESAPHLKLEGKRVAFTGRLAAMDREEAFQLVRKYDGLPLEDLTRDTDFLVVGMLGWAALPGTEVSRSYRQAEKWRGQGASLEILPEFQFLTLTGQRAPRLVGSKSLAVDQVSNILAVSVETIQRWTRLGFVLADECGNLDIADIAALRVVSILESNGVKPRTIQATASEIDRLSKHVSNSLGLLDPTSVRKDNFIARVNHRLMGRHGQYLLDFDANEPAIADPSVLKFEPSAKKRREAVFGQRESLFDEVLETDRASHYRQAIVLDPTNADAYYNLSNLLARTGRTQAAEEIYRIVLALEPDHLRGLYNLAGLLYTGNRFEEAVACLKHALGCCPTFADAHYNLALCLEQLGDTEQAQVHWRKYTHYDSASRWADTARRHINNGQVASEATPDLRG